MNWNEHLKLEGKHAFLSASKYAWINYDEEKLITVYKNWQAVQRGTVLHDFAKRCIELGQKLPPTKQTLNMYVNDAIGFKMRPEQILFYSDNCFGTADAISFKNKFVRIHDLKTGKTKASMHQLEIYAALFCLEYKIRPGEVEFETRIYQNDEIQVSNPSADVIVPIMDTIITFDKLLSSVQEGE